MLKNNIKGRLEKTLPNVYRNLQEALTAYRLRLVLRSFKKKFGQVVQAGPFTGMTYVSEAVCSSLAPKLLGSYESELHGVIGIILATNYERVIDVGCAEGYYAVGLAMRLPSSRIYAFDVDERARQLCQMMAEINKVDDRVVVEGECTHERLNALVARKRALVVCDCEGCELQLLDPRYATGLIQSDLLVELHDVINPKISQAIIERFSRSHEVTIIDSTERVPDNYPALELFSPLTRRAAVSEFRGGQMQWAFLQARAVHTQTPTCITPPKANCRSGLYSPRQHPH